MRKVSWIGWIALAAALLVGVWLAHQADQGIKLTATGHFVRDGEYPTPRVKQSGPQKYWGSWHGNDANVGELTFGPFPATRAIAFLYTGFPNTSGVRISLFNDTRKERISLTLPDSAGAWVNHREILPNSWKGEPTRLIVTDDSALFTGWVGITEPKLSAYTSNLPRTLFSWAVITLALGILYLAAIHLLPDWQEAPSPWVPLFACAGMATLGYCLFWITFFSPLLGKAMAWLSIAAAAPFALKVLRRPQDQAGEAISVAGLGAVLSLFYCGMLYLTGAEHDFLSSAQTRFLTFLPGDNSIPGIFAGRILDGNHDPVMGGGWLTGDRPPLQSGWTLLTLPLTRALGVPDAEAFGASGLWFQLIWITGVFGTLREVQLSRSKALAWTACLAFTGFFLHQSLFTWPKLGPAAFTIGAFVFCAASHRRHNVPIIGWLVALSWLAHGATAFSLLALAPWILVRLVRGPRTPWLYAGALFLIFALPWTIYQKTVSPPANRLFKWHLAGQVDVDSRTVGRTLRDEYAKLTWSQILGVRMANLRRQNTDTWSDIGNPSPEGIHRQRVAEFFFPVRTIGFWWLGVGAWFGSWIILIFRRAQYHAPLTYHLALWASLTFGVWISLVFREGAATVHQSSYALLVAVFLLSVLGLEALPKWVGISLVVAQTGYFFFVWSGSVAVDPSRWDFAAATLVALTFALMASQIYLGFATKEKALGQVGV